MLASASSWFSLRDLSSDCLDADWLEVSLPEELNVTFLEDFNPEFIFFPHWNARIPSEILERWNCVVFHTAPLPFGRGGSPIQNLIRLGFSSAPVNALRAVDEIDAGPIYASEEIDLSGSLEDIFTRISVAVRKLISFLVHNHVDPVEQVGEVVNFSRRHRDESQILKSDSARVVYDKIRMVDFADYPRAYINFGQFHLIFTKAALENGVLSARVEFGGFENEFDPS